MAREPNGNPDVPRKPESPASITGPVNHDARLTTKARTGTVIVGCKTPNGIIMQLSTAEKSSEPVMGGGHREVTVGRKVGVKYEIRGTSVPFGTVPKFIMAGGYALTSGIPEDFWEKWLEQNRDADIVQRELIVAHKSMDDVDSHCVNNETLKTGLEPIDPNAMPRGFGNIGTAKEEMGQRR